MLPVHRQQKKMDLWLEENLEPGLLNHYQTFQFLEGEAEIQLEVDPKDETTTLKFKLFVNKEI